VCGPTLEESSNFTNTITGWYRAGPDSKGIGMDSGPGTDKKRKCSKGRNEENKGKEKIILYEEKKKNYVIRYF
jgi:hypothetical protein